MGEISKIEWTDATFNPWWGCIEVSPACDNCYARTFAKRTGHDIWGPAGETGRRFFADKHWAEPLKWQAKAEREGRRLRVFCASMADVFEQNEALDVHRHRLWSLILATPNLDWLLLTKRPQNIKRMVWPDWLVNPLPNVWYGTTVENQHYADQRIPILLGVPAAVRFLSMEPLLGPVDLFTWDEDEGALRGPAVIKSGGMTVGTSDSPPEGYDDSYSGIHWVITGGESGHGSRPANPDWYRSLRDQCVAAGVAFHFKQWGDIDEHGNRVGKKAAGRLLDGRTWDELPEAPAAAGLPAEHWPPPAIEGEQQPLTGFDDVAPKPAEGRYPR